jgi:tRNA threonylcarbamoyladenosine biosynthesis protein TsaE
MECTVTLEELEDFSKRFWERVNHARVFAMHGTMGAGKTTIIEALCREKGVRSHMSSPTFSIINEYVFNDGGKEGVIYHMDLYRLKSEEEVIQAGVEDAIYSKAICFVEWPEKAPGIFDEHTVHLFIEPVNESVRKVIIELPT